MKPSQIMPSMLVTQGTELMGMYGEEAAKMYAGMMEEELKKTIPDLEALLQSIPSSGGTILDTCVGSGHMFEWISNNDIVGDDDEHYYSLHGIDLSTDMLNQARQRLSKNDKSKGAVLGHANMLETRSLNLEPGSCAAVLNTFALHHATPEQAEAAIRDWSLLLKDDGGCLYLGLWEGSGYMEEHHPGIKSILHSENDVRAWIGSAGLRIIMSRSQVETEFGNMNTLYLICQKKKKKIPEANSE